ncbi:MAG: hypothetical protein M3Y23_03780 [Actinomycetota bacterium]|nr:hypothetical protein [Actinomycetota bacterium]
MGLVLEVIIYGSLLVYLLVVIPAGVVSVLKGHWIDDSWTLLPLRRQVQRRCFVPDHG